MKPNRRSFFATLFAPLIAPLHAKEQGIPFKVMRGYNLNFHKDCFVMTTPPLTLDRVDYWQTLGDVVYDCRIES
jgi:hypothetical protein